MLELLLLITAVLPLAWLLSETQRHRWISVVLGIASLVIVGFVMFGWAAIRTGIDLSVSYGEASKSLATAIDEELDAGNVDHVKQELKRFIQVYHPNYENTPRYDEMIGETVERLRKVN